MPTDTLTYLLSNPPAYELHADCTPVIDALVGAGYLERQTRLVELMVDSWQLPDGVDVTYVLTLSGAALAAGEPYARLHSAWRKRLAKALEREDAAA